MVNLEKNVSTRRSYTIITTRPIKINVGQIHKPCHEVELFPLGRNNTQVFARFH